MEKKGLFIRLAMVEQKSYDEIAAELGVERSQLSEWWEESLE
jgi:transposase-like protein